MLLLNSNAIYQFKSIFYFSANSFCTAAAQIMWNVCEMCICSLVERSWTVWINHGSGILVIVRHCSLYCWMSVGKSLPSVTGTICLHFHYIFIHRFVRFCYAQYINIYVYVKLTYFRLPSIAVDLFYILCNYCRSFWCELINCSWWK